MPVRRCRGHPRENRRAYDQGKHEEARTLALEAVASASPAEKAELCWRASHETLELGDEAEDRSEAKDVILKTFEKGQEYADMAIAANPQNNLGVLLEVLQHRPMGRGERHPELPGKSDALEELLEKDLALDANHPGPYPVLGALYRLLPGTPISFGDIDAAVFPGPDGRRPSRESRAGREEKAPNYSYLPHLAKSLWKRNLPPRSVRRA